MDRGALAAEAGKMRMNADDTSMCMAAADAAVPPYNVMIGA